MPPISAVHPPVTGHAAPSGPASARGASARGAGRGGVPGSGVPSAVALKDTLAGLSVRAMWKAFRKQSPAFWFTTLYIFFEYVRPQQIYGWLDVAPWPLMCLLGAVVFSIMEGRIRFTAGFMWVMIAVFTLVIIASGVVAQYPAESWRWKDIWLNWLLLMLVVGAGVRTRTEFLLLIAGFVLWNLKMSQHGFRAFIASGGGFVAWGVSGAPGWFQNSGEFGIEMCVFMPIIGYLAYGFWPQLTRNKKIIIAMMALSALLSIIASSSRGALIGAAGVGLWIMLRSPNRLRASMIVLVLAGLAWVTLPAGSKARFSSMGEDADSVRRLTYWGDAMEIASEHPVFGIGYKNWIPYYRLRYNPEGELPHNFAMESMAELGYGGTAVLAVLFLAFFMQNAKTRRLTSPTSSTPDRFLHSMAYGIDGAMIGFMVSGSFVSVLWYPFIWMNLALCMALARVTVTQQEEMGRSRRRMRRPDPRRAGPRAVAPAMPAR